MDQLCLQQHCFTWGWVVACTLGHAESCKLQICTGCSQNTNQAKIAQKTSTLWKLSCVDEPLMEEIGWLIRNSCKQTISLWFFVEIKCYRQNELFYNWGQFANEDFGSESFQNLNDIVWRKAIWEAKDQVACVKQLALENAGLFP